MKLIEKFRLWKANRNLLIINFGTNPGRVPIVLLSRDEVENVEKNENRISFKHKRHLEDGWLIVVVLKNCEIATELKENLKKRKVGVLEAFEPISSIIYYRPDRMKNSGGSPAWVAGKFDLAEDKIADYDISGNHAYIHKHYEAEPIAAGQRR